MADNSDLLDLSTTPVAGLCAVPEEHSSSLLSSLLDTSFSVQLPSGNSLETERYDSSSSSSMSSDDELRLMRAEAKVAAANLAAEAARVEQLNARIEQRTLESEIRSRSSHGSKGHKKTVTGSISSPSSGHQNTVAGTPSSDHPTVYEAVGSPPVQMTAAVSALRVFQSVLLQARVLRQTHSMFRSSLS